MPAGARRQGGNLPDFSVVITTNAKNSWHNGFSIPLPRGTPPGYVDELAVQLAP